jgi:hypothetical protein
MTLKLAALCTALGLVLGLSGCTLAIETELQQCKVDDDCASLSGGNVAQRCVKNFCEKLTCETTSDCREQAKSDKDPLARAHCSAGVCEPAECDASGGCDKGSVCQIELGQCVAEEDATCDPTASNQGDDDCKRYAGFDEHVCIAGTCQKAECSSDEQCQVNAMTATYECDRGRCADLTWGCLGKDVERDVPMSGTATLEVTVISLVSGGSIEKLDVQVCSVQGDPECTMPLDADWSYNKETSLLKVTGLKQKSLVRLLMQAPLMADVEWYSQRATIGTTTESSPTILVPPDTGQLLGAQFEPDILVDMETKATLIARIYNCKGEAAVGVSLGLGTQLKETQIFYTNESNQVLVDKLETASPGAAGAVNVSPQATRVTIRRDGDLVTEFDFTPRTQRITYLQLYPQVF